MRTNERAMANCVDLMRDDDDPTAAVDRRELVVAALAQLPESPRNTVALRVMHGLSGNEVSEMLGVSVSQVSRWLHEGLDRLREFLDDDRGNMRGI
jgi:RNA polymerase sigma factor (sigma-70 family)